MRQRYLAWVVALAAAVSLAAPAPASAQRARSRSGGSDSGGSQGGGRAVPRDGGGASAPAPRSGGSTSRPAAEAPRSGGGNRTGTATPSRPREGRRITGEAVPRSSALPPSDGGDIIVVPGRGYYPGGWGYGGLGLGGYYGFYDPWYYGGYGGYGRYGRGYYGQSYYASGYDGSLRLKMKPRDASVFVDGYFAGRVDEFDGVFQRLRIEPGPHRIEVRADGYEPLTFEVRILPDRTITYEGDLDPLP